MDSFKQFSKKQERKDHLSWNNNKDIEHHPEEKNDRKDHLSWNNTNDLDTTKKKLKEDLDHPSLSKEQIDSFHEHRKSFNNQHAHYLGRYKDQSSVFNQAHRLKSKVKKERFKDMTKHMDHITSQKIKHPMEVHRGFGSDFDVTKLKTGSHFTDHGYTGTSLSKHIASGFADGSYDPETKKYSKHLAHIHVPAGAKGHYLDLENHPHSNKSFLGKESEHEFLLHRGTKFKVGHHEKDKEGNHIVHLHVVPKKETVKKKVAASA